MSDFCSPSATGNVTGKKTDFHANAREGWGAEPPDWVVELASQCALYSATFVARKLDYTVAVVSGVVRNNYKGDLGKVEAKVRGAFMGAVVDCPILCEIERDRCIQEQGFKHFSGSANRARLYRACRGGCAHSRLRKESADV